MGTYGPGGATGGGGAGDGPKKFKRKKPLDPTGFIMLDQESRMHYRSFRDQPVLQVSVFTHNVLEGCRYFDYQAATHDIVGLCCIFGSLKATTLSI